MRSRLCFKRINPVKALIIGLGIECPAKYRVVFECRSLVRRMPISTDYPLYNSEGSGRMNRHVDHQILLDAISAMPIQPISEDVLREKYLKLGEDNVGQLFDRVAAHWPALNRLSFVPNLKSYSVEI